MSFDRAHTNKLGSNILDKICSFKEQYASHIEKTERTSKFALDPAKINIVKAIYLFKFQFDIEVFNERWPIIRT